jgi:ApaG protein
MSPKQELSITVNTRYVENQSEPDSNRYVFSYTITISNRGTKPVQLMSRHWVITDANARIQEVIGDGVVGQQPIIAPGESFQYTSGAILDTAVGVMEGKYFMERENGDQFEANIPGFTLSVPRVLH